MYMHRHLSFYLALLLLLPSHVQAAAPSTDNSQDQPDPQRLPLTRLQCGCHFVKNRAKAVPINEPSSFVSLQQTHGGDKNKEDKKRMEPSLKLPLLLDLAERQQQGERARGSMLAEPPSVAAKAPDRMECGCHTVKSKVHTAMFEADGGQ